MGKTLVDKIPSSEFQFTTSEESINKNRVYKYKESSLFQGIYLQ